MTQLEILKSRIPYDVEDFEFSDYTEYEAALNQLLDDSRSIALANLYPFEDYYNYILPNKYLNWQIRCAVELFVLGDKAGYATYSENGIGWSKFSDGLSRMLMNELIPNASAPFDAVKPEIE